MENDEPSYRPCTQCRRLEVPFHDSRKMCERCRAKARKRSQTKKLALAAPLPQSQLPPPQPSQLKTEKIRYATLKAPKQISEKTTVLQYQKASSLYDAIRLATSSSPRCNFAGCHSIVHCDNIDHARRAHIVAKDLRKIVKIPFKYNTPLKSSIKDTKVRVKYSCTCSLSPPKTLTSTKPSTQPHRSDNITGVACGGAVFITVRGDDSHPLGIPGQQIIVEIVH